METANSESLTVVIPVYNRAGLVGRVLKSLAGQSMPGFKVVLVDNGSTDGSLEVLEHWASEQGPHVRVLQEKRKGAASARQCGLDAVDTEWTLFFDSDDDMTTVHIERVAKAIAANKDADVIGWDVVADCGGGVVKRSLFSRSDVQYRNLFNGTMATLRYTARTRLFRAAGGWNRNIGIWDDIELGARILAREPKVVYLKGEPTVYSYVQTDSMTAGENAANIAKINPALESIKATLGPGREHWVELKRVILAGESGGAAAVELRDEAIGRVSGRMMRLLYRLAYYGIRLRLRGVSRVLRPFM